MSLQEACNVYPDKRSESGCTAKYCKVKQQSRIAKTKYKRYREEREGKKREKVPSGGGQMRNFGRLTFSDPRGSTIEHREGKRDKYETFIM